MPAGVGIPQRIVARVAIAVQALRVARVGHHGVGLGKAGEGRVVISRIVKVQARYRIQPLAGVAVGCGHCSTGVAVCARPRAAARGRRTGANRRRRPTGGPRPPGPNSFGAHARFRIQPLAGVAVGCGHCSTGVAVCARPVHSWPGEEGIPPRFSSALFYSRLK